MPSPRLAHALTFTASPRESYEVVVAMIDCAAPTAYVLRSPMCRAAILGWPASHWHRLDAVYGTCLAYGAQRLRISTNCAPSLTHSDLHSSCC
jgi:hypothetical protein